MILRHRAIALVSRRCASTYADLNADAVRKGDYGQFLVAHFWPPALRDSVVALHAFNLELASIPDSVSNTQLGTLRYKFWRDAVAAAFDNKPPQHPVALGLTGAVQQGRLSKYHFDRIINAREANFRSSAFTNLDALSRHAQDTVYRLLALQLQLALSSSTLKDADQLSTLDHSLTHVALAQSIATLLASLPFHASKRHSVFPADVAAEAGLVEETLFRQGRSAPGVTDAVAHLASVAEGQMAVAREHLPGKLDPSVYPVFLSAAPAVDFLGRLRKAKYDAFSPALQRRSPWLPMKVWYQSNRRKI